MILFLRTVIITSIITCQLFSQVIDSTQTRNFSSNDNYNVDQKKTISFYQDSIRTEIEDKKSNRFTWFIGSVIGFAVTAGIVLLGNSTYSDYQNTTDSQEALDLYDQAKLYDTFAMVSLGVSAGLLSISGVSHLKMKNLESSLSNIPISIMKTYEDSLLWKGQSYDNTTDGGFVILGNFKNDLSNYNMFVFKANHIGNIEWIKSHSFKDNIIAKSIKQTNDGGYIILGNRKDPDTRLTDIECIRTDMKGNILWSNTYGNQNSERGQEIFVTSANTFHIVATLINSQNREKKIWNLSIDAVGNVISEREIDLQLSNEEYSLCLNQAGNCVLFGSYQDKLNTKNHLFLSELNTEGEILWLKVFKNTDNVSRSNSIKESNGGGYNLLASYPSYYGEDSFLKVLKTDKSGNIVFEKSYEFNENVIGNDIIQNRNSTYTILAKTAGNAVLLKTNTVGDIEFYQEYGADGEDTFNFMLEALDGSYILVGNTNSNLMKSHTIWFAKTYSFH